MRVDAHTHVDISKKNEIASVTNLLSEMKNNEIDFAVVFPLSNSIQCNELMMEQIKGIDHLFPLAFIDPNWEDAFDKLKKCIDGLRMKGLKLHPTLCDFHVDDLKKMHCLYEYCDKKRLHIVIHCTSDDRRVHPYRIETVAKLYPNATFQIAHMGAIWDADAAIAVAKRNSNVYLDTGIASFNAIRRAINEVPDKLLMGADFPFYTYRTEIMKITEAFRYSDFHKEYEVLENVLGNNFLKIINKEVTR